MFRCLYDFMFTCFPLPGQNSIQLLHFVQDKQLFYPSSVISLSYLKGEENNMSDVNPDEVTTAVEGEEVAAPVVHTEGEAAPVDPTVAA